MKNFNPELSKHIFLACQPKSGSTFLSNVLTEITHFKLTQFRQRPIDNLNEQDIYLPAMLDLVKTNTVTQQHSRATKNNLDLLRKLNAITIILTRNMFDVVISSLDHSENTNITGSPMLFANNAYFKLSQQEKINMIIDLAIPWHIHFYSSWYDAIENCGFKSLWITYEELIADEVSTVDSKLFWHC